jgi:hypothetical protein
MEARVTKVAKVSPRFEILCEPPVASELGEVRSRQDPQTFSLARTDMGRWRLQGVAG